MTHEDAARRDIEAGPTELTGERIQSAEAQGYQKLAHLMGKFPDHAIFRRFGWLSMLNLMRLQAELMKLEEDLRERQMKDRIIQEKQGLKDGKTYATSFEALAEAKLGKGGEKQSDLMERSTAKLHEYSKH